MSKIPTAEEFSKNFTTGKAEETTQEYITNMLVEFAKLHVEAALKLAAENVEINDYDEHHQYSPNVDEKSILNSYPLTNIK